MKKLKILSLAVFPLLLAGCNLSTSSSSSLSERTSSSVSTSSQISSSSETSSGSSSESSSSSAPILEGAYVSIGDGERVKMEPYQVPEEELQPIKAYKLEHLDLLKDDEVTFTYNGSIVTTNLYIDNGDVEGVNATYIEEFNEILIHNSASDAGIYFKEFDDYYSFWISGREAPIQLKSNDTDWKGRALELVDGSSTEYYISNVAFTETSEFKIHVYDDGDYGWHGYSDVKDGCLDLVKKSPEIDHEGEKYSEDNIMVVTPGNYTIYFESEPAIGEKSIWIEKVPDPVTRYDGYAIEINDDGFLFYLEPHVGVDDQFIIEFSALSAGDRIDFYGINEGESGVKLTTQIVPDEDDASKNTQNNLKPVTPKGVDFTILKDSESEETLYFTVHTTSYSFWLSGGPSIPDASVKVGGVSYLMNTYTDEALFKPKEQYRADNIEVKKGQKVEFIYHGFPVTYSIGPDGDDHSQLNADFNSETCEIIIHNDANANLYFKVWDEGFSFWISGKESIVMIKGSDNEWAGEKMEPVKDSTTEFVIKGYELSAESEFKIHDVDAGDIGWFGYDDVKEGCKSLVKEATADNNIMVVTPGKYDIYYDRNPDVDGNYIWVAPVKDPAPIYDSYFVQVNDGELVELEEEKGTIIGPLKEFKTTFIRIYTGDIISFYGANGEDDPIELKEFLAPQPDDYYKNPHANNLKAGEDGWTVQSGGDALTLRLDLFEFEHTFWLTGGNDLPVPTDITITATCSQDWAYATQIPLFAWVWGKNNPGQWIEIDFIAFKGLRQVTFDAPEGTVGFLLVRCSESTIFPDWDIKSGDLAGRIYNKTEDKTIIDGVSTYSVTFVDYPGK